MDNKGTLIIYPDVYWVPLKSFSELEQAGLVYKFQDFIDEDDIDSIQILVNQVSAHSKTFDHWTASFIPNTGKGIPL